MRRFLFVLLVLVLPLRGWIGDAMAVQMAFSGSAHSTAAAEASHSGDHAHAHDDHAIGHRIGSGSVHDHAAPGDKLAGAGGCDGHVGDDAIAAGNTDHCGTCAMCQTCHTVAVLNVLAVPEYGPVRLAAPQLAAQGFISAERALALKPPKA